VAAAPPIAVEVYSSFETLPPALIAFLATAAEGSFFRSLAWYRAVVQSSGRRTDLPRIYAALCAGRPVAMLVARERRNAGRLKTHMLLGPSGGMYVPRYEPILDAELGGAGLGAIAAAIARETPPFDLLRFDGLEPRSPEVAALHAAFRKCGMLLQPFLNYFNFYDEVQGVSIEHYLERLTPETRSFIDLARQEMQRSGRGRFELIRGGPDLKPALIDYALIDVQSRTEEPYSNCTMDILRIAAGAGVLRLGLFYIDDEPAAAQAWIISGGRATIWRSHHARRFFPLFVETVLTYDMFRHMLEAEQIQEIVFGSGHDEFLRDWLRRDRERAGLLVFNPRTLKGLIVAARHIGGHLAMGLARPSWQLLRRGAARVR